MATPYTVDMDLGVEGVGAAVVAVVAMDVAGEEEAVDIHQS